MEYFEKLINLISNSVINFTEKNILLAKLNNELTKFNNNILYKAPEQLPIEFKKFKINLTNIIVFWIETNGGHDSIFAQNFRNWNIVTNMNFI